MKRQLGATTLVIAVLLMSMLVLSACGGSNSGAAGSVKGQVTKIDVAAKTFSVDSGGKNYDFRFVSDSKGDINEVKKHMDTKEQLEVQYKGTSSPYDVINAD